MGFSASWMNFRLLSHPSMQALNSAAWLSDTRRECTIHACAIL